MKTLLILLLLVFSLRAKYDLFIDRCQTVGPGMVYKHLFVLDKLWNINILEIDLTNPYVKIETVKARNSCQGVETVSSMAGRRTFVRHQVVAAINGDFFSIEGIPNNVQVIQGQILQNPIEVSAIGFDVNNRPWLGTVSFKGELITPNGSHVIHGVNKERGFNETILYNSYYGRSTRTDKWGSEIAIRPITPWIVNDTVWAVVQAKECLKGNMTIPENGAVISGQGEESIIFLNNNAVIGDTIALVLKLTPAIPRLVELMGGLPKIVYKGKNWAANGFREEHGPVHAFQIHPRTAIGFNADSTKLYFFTVDGRKPPVYRGMTLPELADLMIDFGVAYGVNLDGGGSTTFYLQNRIVNIPTEGHERPVAAAILAVSTAPENYYENFLIAQEIINFYDDSKINFPFKILDKIYDPLTFLFNRIKENIAQTNFNFRDVNNNAQQNHKIFAGSEKEIQPAPKQIALSEHHSNPILEGKPVIADWPFQNYESQLKINRYSFQQPIQWLANILTGSVFRQYASEYAANSSPNNLHFQNINENPLENNRQTLFAEVRSSFSQIIPLTDSVQFKRSWKTTEIFDSADFMFRPESSARFNDIKLAATDKIVTDSEIPGFAARNHQASAGVVVINSDQPSQVIYFTYGYPASLLKEGLLKESKMDTIYVEKDGLVIKENF